MTKRWICLFKIFTRHGFIVTPESASGAPAMTQGQLVNYEIIYGQAVIS